MYRRIYERDASSRIRIYIHCYTGGLRFFSDETTAERIKKNDFLKGAAKIMSIFPKYSLRDIMGLSIQEMNILGHMANIIEKEEFDKQIKLSGR